MDENTKEGDQPKKQNEETSTDDITKKEYDDYFGEAPV
jgi:hypothetical protein